MRQKNQFIHLYMRHTMSRLLVALLSIMSLSVQAYAGDYGFEDTSEGIANALTCPAQEQPVRTRSLTRSFTPRTRAIKVVKKDQGKIVVETVTVSEGPTPQSVNLKIEFDSNSYAIRPESFRLLHELGKALISDRIKRKKLTLKGHTDSDGPDAYNLNLSLNRALSVRSYLVGNFEIEPDRIRVAGYGESMPLVPNTLTVHKQLNRRVEVQAVP